MDIGYSLEEVRTALRSRWDNPRDIDKELRLDVDQAMRHILPKEELRASSKH